MSSNARSISESLNEETGNSRKRKGTTLPSNLGVESQALPARVTLKKNLIHEMMNRLAKRTKSSGKEDSAADDEDDEQVPNEELSPTRSQLAHHNHVIIKQENDSECPKIETVSGAVTLPEAETGRVLDIAMSTADDHEDDDDDAFGDPDFDPDSLDFDRNSKHAHKRRPTRLKNGINPNKPKSSTTCETCCLRFMSVVNYKIHMRENHNEYTSEEEDVEETEAFAIPSPQQSGQFACEHCHLQFATPVGRQIHLRQKHGNVKNKVTAHEEIILDDEPKQTDPPKQRESANVPKVLYVCSFPNCDHQFSSIQNMKIHKCLGHQYTPKSAVRCILCPAVTLQPNALLQHFKTSHPGQVDEEGYREFSRLGYSEDDLGFEVQKASLKSNTAQKTRNFQGNDVRVKKLPLLVPVVVPATVQVGSKEALHEREIINLDDSDEEIKKRDSNPPKNPKPAIRKPTTKSKGLSTPATGIAAPAVQSLGSKSPSVVTICPYCFKSVLFKEFPSHIQIHATEKANKVKTFPCPYTGCKEMYSKLEDLINHHKSFHQEKQHTPSSQTQKSVSEPTTIPLRAVPAPSPTPAPSAALTDIVGFMCSVCVNVSFPDMESLLLHCQNMHSKTTPAAIPSSAVPESNRLSKQTSIELNTKLQVLTSEQDPLATEDPSLGVKISTVYSLSSNDIITPDIKEEVIEIGVRNPPSLKCSICQIDGFTNQAEVDMHILSHPLPSVVLGTEEAQQTFGCELCETTYSTHELRNEHYMSFHKLLSGNLPGKCPICQVEVKQSRNMPKHMRSVHLTFQCTMCPQLFKIERLYQKHVNLHSAVPTGSKGEKQYQCLECLMIFRAAQMVSHHYASVHSKGDKCTCVTCNIQLQRKNLQKHLELHRREIENGTLVVREQTASAEIRPDAGNIEDSNSTGTIPAQTTSTPAHFQGDIKDEILRDPLAEPGEEQFDSVHIFQHAFESTQFEFEDVTIGEEHLEHT